MGCAACKDCQKDVEGDEVCKTGKDWDEDQVKQTPQENRPADNPNNEEVAGAESPDEVFGAIKYRVADGGAQSNGEPVLQADEPKPLRVEEERKIDATVATVVVENNPELTPAAVQVTNGNGDNAKKDPSPPLSFQERMLEEMTKQLPLLTSKVPP